MIQAIGRGGNRGQGDRGDDHRAHRAADHDLDLVRLGGEGIGREARPRWRRAPTASATARIFGRPRADRLLGGAPRLDGVGRHIGPVGEGDQGNPADDQLEPFRSEQGPGDEQSSADAVIANQGANKSAGLGLAVVEMGLAKPLAARIGADAFVRPASTGSSSCWSRSRDTGAWYIDFQCAVGCSRFPSRRVLMEC